MRALKPKLLTLLPSIFKCVCDFHIAVTLAASRCITSMAKSTTKDVMGAVIKNAIPMLRDMTSVYTRQGAGILISLFVQGLGVELVPYAPLLVVPLLKGMSDCDQSVRQSVDLFRNAEEAQFLEQLLDNSHIDDYKLQCLGAP